MALTFLEPRERSVAGHAKALYRCDCGNEVIAQVNNVKSGNTQSCGCSRIIHGQVDTPLYSAWTNMRQRATNRKIYPHYADVHCDPRWVTFEGFLANPPTVPDGHDFQPGMCLARLNDTGDYTPENARWRTRVENCQEQIRKPKETCNYGHDLTDQANRKPNGTCRTCAQRRNREWRARKCNDN